MKEPELGKATLHLGFNNIVMRSEIVAFQSPLSAKAMRIKRRAEEEGRLIDMTHGRRTRALVITKSNHVLLSMVTCEMLRARVERMEEGNG